MKKQLENAVIAGLSLSVVGICLVWLGWNNIETGPEFYQEALEIDENESVAASMELKHEATEVVQQIDAGEKWELTITEDQVNGWFATELSKIMSQKNIQYVSEPRVKIETQGATLACRWTASALSGVLVCKLTATLDSEQQTIKVQLGQIRSGWVAIHRDRWEPDAKRSLANANLPITWDDQQSNPEITVDLSEIKTETGRTVRVESLAFLDGSLQLQGSSL